MFKFKACPEPVERARPLLNQVLLTIAAAAIISGCNCSGVAPNADGGSGGGTAGAAGGGSGGGTGGAAGGGTGGGAPIQVDPNDLNNAFKDSDCDGLTDAEEFGNTYAGGKRTDPAKADSDGDGIKDGVEAGRTASVDLTCGFVADADPSTHTLPTETDSDADGVGDGVEDTDHNGRADTGESDAANPDSDFDGLKDGEEDLNGNGSVDSGETDPRKKDTDGDFINDGIEKKVTHTDPTKLDTDGDTCSDGAEDTNQNGTVQSGETDPNNAADCGVSNNPDADADGVPNNVEDANHNNVVDTGETDPNNPDSDGDGLKDGIEDKNFNGLLDPGETNPRRKDSDCDGLLDGPTQGQVMGEDQNSNGLVDTGETDPTKRDSDGDGITDGVERGVILANVADAAGCGSIPVDLDPAVTTDPTKRDSDSDGIDDGAEDTNQNGRVDVGELNPKDGTDGTGPAGQVCTTNNLRPVLFKTENEPDLQLGLPASFTEVSTMSVGTAKRGLIGYDPTNKVAFVAWREAARGGATSAQLDEAQLRILLNGVGTLSNGNTQNFTSWDSIGAMQGTYDQAGGVDLKARANAIALSLVGAGAGALSGSAGVNGPFHLQVEYLHRTDAAVVVVVALTPSANYAGTPLFTMSDTAGGSAVAQFSDANAVQCEKFQPQGGKVDFVFVVDDSGSMAGYQSTLGTTAAAIAQALNNSTLDWRVAMVSTEYHENSGGHANRAIVRGFSRDIQQFQAWLTQNAVCTASVCMLSDGGSLAADGGPADAGPLCESNGPGSPGSNGGCWIATGGNGSEGLLGAGRKLIDDITPGTDAGTPEQVALARKDAQLVVILLGDADDQTTGYGTIDQNCVRTAVNANTCESVNNFINFFGPPDGGTASNKTARKIPVHGIVCSDGADTDNGTAGIQRCGEDQGSPLRHAAVISATGGIRGDIDVSTSIVTSVNNIINSTIAAAGYRMQKPPIGASVKVALSSVLNGSACTANDIPRDRTNGFDFDGINRTLSFFGACRPSTSTTVDGAVSYRYWVDTTPNPGGNPPPCSTDPYYDPTSADFCLGKLECNLETNVCECPTNCGGTPPVGKVCNSNRQVCDYVCTADCGGTCNGFQQCNTTECACECVQTASCGVGYRFQNGAGVCGCVCDTAALNCGATYDPDAASCSCVCKPACGGCMAGDVCNPSTCSCTGGIN